MCWRRAPDDCAQIARRDRVFAVWLGLDIGMAYGRLGAVSVQGVLGDSGIAGVLWVKPGPHMPLGVQAKPCADRLLEAKLAAGPATCRA
jgi:hypothetical protein